MLLSKWVVTWQKCWKLLVIYICMLFENLSVEAKKNYRRNSSWHSISDCKTVTGAGVRKWNCWLTAYSWHSLWYEVRTKCTLVQALTLCIGRTVHRGSRRVALLSLDHGTRSGWWVSVTPRPLFAPRERPGTHFTGGWVGPRAGLDRWVKSCPHRDSITGPPSP